MTLIPGDQTAIPFKLYLNDHISPALGKAALLAPKYSRDGAVLAPAGGIVVETADGDYAYHPLASETLAHGAFILHFDALPGCDPVDLYLWVGDAPIVAGAVYALPFFLSSTTDHVTGVTGVTPTVTLSKAEAAFAAPAGVLVPEIGAGWWALRPVVADTLTPGAFVLHATATGADTVDDPYQVFGTAPVVPWCARELLRRFKRMAGLADASEEDDTIDLYPILATAEGEVIRQIAMRYPNACYPSSGPATLTPSVDHKTFTFGNDAHGNPIVPMGWVQISPRLTAFAGDDGYFWREGVDFLDEGTQIRLPGNRTYTGTLYARFIPTPPGISATVEPILQPADARQLVIIQAVMDWANEGNTRPDLVAAMEKMWDQKFPPWMLTYRRRFRGGGALLDPSLWYLYAPDLGGGGSS